MASLAAMLFFTSPGCGVLQGLLRMLASGKATQRWHRWSWSGSFESEKADRPAEAQRGSLHTNILHSEASCSWCHGLLSSSWPKDRGCSCCLIYAAASSSWKHSTITNIARFFQFTHKKRHEGLCVGEMMKEPRGSTWCCPFSLITILLCWVCAIVITTWVCR